MGLLEDMILGVEHIDTEWEDDKTLTVDEVVTECARVALFDMKTKLMAYFPVLQNLETTLAAHLTMDEIDVQRARRELKMAMDFIRQWDVQLAKQA